MQTAHAFSYLPTLRAGRWFSALAPQFADLLLALAQPRSLETGEALFLRGWARASSKSANCGANALNQRPARSVGR